jgi:DNA ligase D-like protein (predicted 3'-phosphoesterase)
MLSRYVIHRHKTGRTHFDLRIVHEEKLRSWSLLKEPPRRAGEKRLAIERENFPIESLTRKNWEEEAFGEGIAEIWDKGEVELETPSSRLMVLRFMGNKLSGRYELRRMIWYPGNRWLLTKSRPSGDLG